MMRLSSSSKKARSSEQGFTLVELMIATAIFAFIVLIATTGIIQLGRLYYKGITQAQVQEVTRSVSDDIGQAVQFNNSGLGRVVDSDTALPHVVTYCLGDTRYRAFLDEPYKNDDPDTDRRAQGLWATTYDAEPDNCANPVGNVREERQLLGNNMRVLAFNVQSFVGDPQNAWNISLRLGYGDDDLMTHYDDNGSFIGPEAPNDPEYLTKVAEASCKSGVAGSSFCAVAQLDTVVKKRL